MSDFHTWLHEAVQAAGGLDAAVVTRGAVAGTGLRQPFQAWLQSENAGKLPYIDHSVEERIDPFTHRPWALNAVVVTFSAGWGDQNSALIDLPAPVADSPYGVISRYVGQVDYHATGQRLLKRLAGALCALYGKPGNVEACVDTRPVSEVFLAVKGGLGVLGMNRLLRTPQHGSRVFIGVLFTDMDLPFVCPDVEGQVDVPCNVCGKCVRSCPGGALSPNVPIALARCRSYLTIEYRGVLNAEQQKLLGNSLFGCDACTAACPPESMMEGQHVDLQWLLTTSAGDVRRRIAGTALERAGVTLLRRNALAILLQRYMPEMKEVVRKVAESSQSTVLRATIEAAGHQV